MDTFRRSRPRPRGEVESRERRTRRRLAAAMRGELAGRCWDLEILERSSEDGGGQVGYGLWACELGLQFISFCFRF